MTTQEAIRQTGLGGSDIAAVAGMNPYRRAYDVWMEKLGIAPPDEQESEAAYWGRALEPVLCDEYARREGVRLTRPPFEHGVMRSPKYGWMLGSPDRFVEGQPIGLDVKMAGLRQARRWGLDGTDFIPDEYAAQAQWYLALTQYDRWDVGVLLGQSFRIFRVFPHQQLQDALIEIGGRFWHSYVEPQIPPPVDHSESAYRMLQRIYPENREPLRPATSEEILLATQLHQVTREIDRDELQRAYCLNRLRGCIALADGITGPGFKVTWRRTRDRRVVNWEHAFRHATCDMEETAIDHLIQAATETKLGTRVLRPTFERDDDGV